MTYINTIKELEDRLSEPSKSLIDDIAKIEGDIMILGVGGKMGPSLAKLAKSAIDLAGIEKKIIGASRFSNISLYDELEIFGIDCIKIDLLNDSALRNLPYCKNVMYMAGNKFGTVGNEHFTWAMNTYLPGRVAETCKDSNIVVFSTGNVYPFVPIDSGGALENVKPSPIGEYAQSCLGRERIFQHFSIKNETKMLLFRLNYALDLRYGVLSEIGKSVLNQKPIKLNMGYANVIWQGDANEFALRSLLYCESPAKILNVTGPETISIKWLAGEFGKLFDIEPVFENHPANTALLNNSTQAYKLFGKPSVSLTDMIKWTAHWLKNDGEELGKRTHFQERTGDF